MNEWIKPLYAGLVVAVLAVAGCSETTQTEGAEDSTTDIDKGWLEADLNDGTWAERYGDLETLDACDLGYRLVVSR